MISAWSLPVSISVFLVCAFVIALFGTWMTRIADRLADLTGFGEAMTGAIFLGGSTSMAGITTSVTAAANGHAELAISNAVGGIAAQTAFLAVADMAYRKINLEHAAASATNLMQGSLLISLLAFPLLALIIPELNIAAIHPVSPLLLIAYFFGLRLISEARAEPMWRPLRTAETRLDIPEEAQSARGDVIKLGGRFLLCAVVVGAAGYVVAKVGVTIAGRTGISETFVGGVFTAVVTSLPELVTSLAAVRQGALTLAVGGIIGGNCFDVLFVAFSDIAFRSGSIYMLLTTQQLFIIVLTILMTSVLLLGMIRREKHGIGNIGFESFLIIVLYFGAFTLLFFKS